MALLAIIPAVHAQSIRKPSPVLRDGDLGPNQIVDDRSKKPFAAPNTRLRPLAFGSGCQPSITKMYSRAAAGATTEQFPGMAYFESPISVATAAGGKVRRIVVHEWTERWWGERYATWPDSPNGSPKGVGRTIPVGELCLVRSGDLEHIRQHRIRERGGAGLSHDRRRSRLITRRDGRHMAISPVTRRTVGAFFGNP
jgi:hypothetical protein